MALVCRPELETLLEGIYGAREGFESIPLLSIFPKLPWLKKAPRQVRDGATPRSHAASEAHYPLTP